MTQPLNATAEINVLYIGGFGRSGSTLLERVLGQIPGVVAVGEVVHLIERGLLGNENCGCGRPFHECPFWSDVGAKAFGGWDRMSGTSWLELKQRVDRNRFIPLMIAPLLPRYRADLAQHCERLTCLYEAIAEVSRAEVIIDSSKQASTAFLLRRVQGIRLRVLHLVRDSRGVAYSWTKAVTRPEIQDRITLMPRFHPARAAARWLAYNALFHLLGPIGTEVDFVRYEDLLATPSAEIARIVAPTGVRGGEGDLPFLADDHVDLGGGHSVAGNPMRFLTGRIDLVPDSAWRCGLHRAHRWIVTVITAPLLGWYGYLSGRRSGAGTRAIADRRRS